MSVLTDAYEAFFDGQLSCFDAETLTVTIGDAVVTVACEGGELISTDELAIGGIIAEPTCVVAVKRSLLSAIPDDRAAVVYRGKNFKIDRIRSTPDRTVLIFDLIAQR